MEAEIFIEMIVVFIMVITAVTIFLNFLLLAAEELKKCSIINKKKKNCATAGHMEKGTLKGSEQFARI